jgi:anti-sigma factor RsiW
VSARSDHDEVAELLGAYALDAVDAEEARRIEGHLAECPRCRGEVDELRDVAAALASQSALEADQPPPELWARISDAVGRSARVAPVDQVPQPSVSRPPASITRLADARRRTRDPRRWLQAIGAAGAAAAIALLALGLVNADGRVHQLQSAVAGSGAQAAVRAALVSPGHKVVRLRTPSGTAVASLVVEHTGAGYVVSSRMSPLPADETYQLWASIGGRPISLGLLGRRPATGTAFSLGSAARIARALMVTVEPAGGVAAPDHAPVAIGALGLS